MRNRKKLHLGKLSRFQRFNKKIKRIMLGTVALLVLCFFFLDDFWLLMMGTVLKEDRGETSTIEVGPPSTDGTSGDTSASDGLTDDGSVYGQTGVTMMKLNAMNAGIYKEYLNIVSQHASWAKMNPDAAKVVDGSGNQIKPTVLSFLGASLMESGLQQNNTMPWTVMIFEDYNKDSSGNYTLSKFNSAWAKQKGQTMFSKGMGSSLQLGTYFTQMQCTHNYFAVWPDGSSGETEKRRYPSLMNGYSIVEGTVRDNKQVDAAYFPDQVAIYYENASHFINLYMDTTEFTTEMYDMASYPFWNAGEGRITASWGLGLDNRGERFWDKQIKAFNANNPGAQGKTLVSDAIKFVSDICDNAIQFLLEHPEVIEEYDDNKYIDHMFWQGFATTSLLLNGAQISTPTSYENFKSRSTENGNFIKGSMLAYECNKGLVGVSESTVKNYLSSISQTPLDDYYDHLYDGKDAYQSGPKLWDIALQYLDTNRSVIRPGHTEAKPALHTYNTEPLRGAFACRIGGAFVYMRMLHAAGVEVNFADAYMDATGLQKMSGSYYNGCGPDVWGFYRNNPKFDDKGTPVNQDMQSWIYYRTTALSGVSREGIHEGEDYGLSFGTDLYAIASGTVVNVCTTIKNTWTKGSPTNGYQGNIVQVEVDRFSESEPVIRFKYMHMAEGTCPLSKGDHVNKGDFVGKSGNTGGGAKEYSYHLHLEVEVQNPVDSKWYKLSYWSLYSGLYSVANAPRLIDGVKKSPGYVYDCQYRQYKLSLFDIRYSTRFVLSRNNYDVVGVNYIWRKNEYA